MNTVCDQCRKVGDKLMLKGERCLSGNCATIKRPYAPGSHGSTDTRSKKSEYGRQLMEKQKAKAIYGMRERQFANYISKAEKTAGNTADNLMRVLETRLDNIVYRLKLAVSRAQARQMVSHGLILVNGEKVSIPSYLLKEGDVIEPKMKNKYADFKADGIPSWLEMNTKKIQGIVKQLPVRDQIDTPINEKLIIEFYSR